MANRSTTQAGALTAAATWGGTLPDFTNDNLTIAHAMGTYSGSLTGTGTLTIANGGSMTMNGGGASSLGKTTTINTGGTLTLTGGTVCTANITCAGNFTMQSGTYDWNTGSLNCQTGGQCDIKGDTAAVSVYVTITVAGLVRFINSAALRGTANMANGGTICILAGATLNGTIGVTGTTAIHYIAISDNGSQVAVGASISTNSYTNVQIGASATCNTPLTINGIGIFTNAQMKQLVTVSSTGNLTVKGDGQMLGGLTNSGTVTVTTPGGAAQVANITNSGTLNVNSYIYLQTGGTGTNTSTGIININAGGVLPHNTSNSGTINLAGTGNTAGAVTNTSTGIINYNGGGSSSGGLFGTGSVNFIGPGTAKINTSTCGGTWMVSGGVFVTGYYGGSTYVTMTNTGVFNASGSSWVSLSFYGGTITFDNAKLYNATNQSASITDNMAGNNSGTVTFTNGASLEYPATISLHGAANVYFKKGAKIRGQVSFQRWTGIIAAPNHFYLQGGTLENPGGVTFNDDTVWSLVGDAVNGASTLTSGQMVFQGTQGGTITFGTYLVGNGGAIWTWSNIAVTVNNVSVGTNLICENLTVSGTGQITGGGMLRYTGSWTFTGGGKSNGGTLSINGGNVTVWTGSTINSDMSLGGGNVTFNSGAMLGQNAGTAVTVSVTSGSVLYLNSGSAVRNNITLNVGRSDSATLMGVVHVGACDLGTCHVVVFGYDGINRGSLCLDQNFTYTGVININAFGVVVANVLPPNGASLRVNEHDAAIMNNTGSELPVTFAVGADTTTNYPLPELVYSGVSYGSGMSGTMTLPDPNYVLQGTYYGPYNGTYGNYSPNFPDPNYVSAGTAYGDGNYSYYGSMSLPDTNHVYYGTYYGPYNNWMGTYVAYFPNSNDVLWTDSYGDSLGYYQQGSYYPSYPSPNDVRENVWYGDSYSSATGCLRVPSSEDVRQGVQYDYYGYRWQDGQNGYVQTGSLQGIVDSSGNQYADGVYDPTLSSYYSYGTAYHSLSDFAGAAYYDGRAWGWGSVEDYSGNWICSYSDYLSLVEVNAGLTADNVTLGQDSTYLMTVLLPDLQANSDKWPSSYAPAGTNLYGTLTGIVDGSGSVYGYGSWDGTYRDSLTYVDGLTDCSNAVGNHVGDIRAGVNVLDPYWNSAPTGNLVVPNISDVRSGLGYGADGAEFSGNLYLPFPGAVLNGYAYGPDNNGNAMYGTYVEPDPYSILMGTSYGNGQYGQFLPYYPDPNLVLSGVGFGDGAWSSTGTAIVPDPQDVRAGVSTTIRTNTGYTSPGRMVVPSALNVTAGVPFDDRCSRIRIRVNGVVQSELLEVGHDIGNFYCGKPMWGGNPAQLFWANDHWQMEVLSGGTWHAYTLPSRGDGFFTSPDTVNEVTWTGFGAGVVKTLFVPASVGLVAVPAAADVRAGTAVGTQIGSFVDQSGTLTGIFDPVGFYNGKVYFCTRPGTQTPPTYLWYSTIRNPSGEWIAHGELGHNMSGPNPGGWSTTLDLLVQTAPVVMSPNFPGPGITLLNQGASVGTMVPTIQITGVNSSYRLGYTATYANNTLAISVWVEKDGSPVDATAITNARLLSGDGTDMAGTTWPDNTTPTNGVFLFTKALALNAGTRLIFACTATVDGKDMTFRVGMARP